MGAFDQANTATAEVVAESSPPPLAPGSVIGLIGGGAVSRALADAAVKLGFEVRSFDPRAEGLDRTFGPDSAWSGDQLSQLHHWADGSDVLCNLDDQLDGRLVESLGRQVPVRPGLRMLRIARKRSRQVRLFQRIGLDAPTGRTVRSVNELQMAMIDLSQPAILRANRPRGNHEAVIGLEDVEDTVAAWRALRSQEGLVQCRIDPTDQLIVLAARSHDGQIALYGPISQTDRPGRAGSPDMFIWPAPVDQSIAMQALQAANRLAHRMEWVGLISINLMVDPAGRIWADQVIPRPTLAGCLTWQSHATDQFTQHVRAVTGQPLGSNESHHAAAMALLYAEHMSAGPIDDALSADAPDVHLYRFQAEPTACDEPMGCLVAGAELAEQATARVIAVRDSLAEGR